MTMFTLTFKHTFNEKKHTGGKQTHVKQHIQLIRKIPVLKRKSKHLRYCTIQHKTDINGLMLCYYIKDITFHKCLFKQQRLYKEIPNK